MKSSCSWALIAVALSCAASAQVYPVKIIRIITGPVGGGNDIAARLIAQGITTHLGQPIVVENRAGLIAVESVAKAQADGHTLLVYGSPTWLQPVLRKASWDTQRDLAPITLANMAVNVLAVHPSLEATSVRALIALAKSRPGKIDYASGETGAANHLAAELFKAMAGVDLVRIPYKATGNAIADLLAGQVQVMFINAAPLAPLMKSGKLRALAVTSPTPSTLFPELPTVAASGVPGYEFVARTGVFAPAGTRAAIVRRLNEEIVRYLNTSEARERFLATGVEVVGSTSAELAATMKSEMVRIGNLVRSAGIVIE